ncbi:hypothetical protein ASPVEDRAFT_38735 [Aspergillus versicolor CBS 583.65]|uniref:Class II aldolase/adducin N-terminal domain-containing protein n=1 Tax=Aspergillus versicolor CBS 583.65 TaxID=1036611 RepID=A0A1L9PCM7_ASPVE|nr:uncharacterized protein ASPVEDRAFT_38735 [Aspergillus versicolor CBS 583.65]OJI99287.1 hypothetical protein ASPVEDRAFT_38735 [Aspergillus versicolor CBS 583.65]
MSLINLTEEPAQLSEPHRESTNTDPTTPQPLSTWQQEVHYLTDKASKITLRHPPTFTSIAETRTHLKQHLAAAFRVLARQNFDEGVAGHISLRDPENPHTFWINPLSTHFAQIRDSDLVLVGDDGSVLPGGAQRPINAPAFAIHAAIHRARPDLNAACHAHSVYGKAFSAFGRPIEMLYQDALRFYNDLAVYPRYGGTVLDRAEGDRIAAALGPKCRSVILQNHGMITCGRTVDEAAFLFLALDRCCHAQLLANAAAACPGWEKRVIEDEMAEVGHRRSGNASKMWLAFQPYFDLVVKEEPELLE